MDGTGKFACGAALVLALGFAGCGAPTQTETTPPPSVQQAATSTGSTAPAEPAKPQLKPLPPYCEGKKLALRSNAEGAERLELDEENLLVPGSSIQEININGDEDLELIVRGNCPEGQACPRLVFAACGDGRYLPLTAEGLSGDRVETSMKGALHGRVYWRDLIVYEFLNSVNSVSEKRTRYRFDGSAWHEFETPEEIKAREEAAKAEEEAKKKNKRKRRRRKKK